MALGVIFLIIGMSLSSCEKQGDRRELLTINSYVENLRVEASIEGNGLASANLGVGESATFKYVVTYKVMVQCAKSCGYSFNGVSYDKSMTFYKGKDY